VVGRPLDGIEEVIIDPNTGERLGANCDGEIRIRGGNVMAGYFKDAEATEAAFDDEGFFRTGDMGRLCDEGFLSITGRIKEMLIIGGENVFPREIEDVIRKHPAVLDAAVIGVPDPMRGEVPLAFVELVEGATAEPTEIRQFCRGPLSGFKVPREVRIVVALPRNPTGKIQRRSLSAETPGKEETSHVES
jgi:acyl-CoA synthetase (AMP-forming)/AMP-acid ligase II